METMWKIISAIALIVSMLAPYSAAQAAQPTTTEAYLQWRAASPTAKQRLIATVISAIQTGWSLGSAQAQAEIGGYLVDQSQRGVVSIQTAGAAGSLRLKDPPRYSHPLFFYVKAIDRPYDRYPQNRAIDVPSLLVCFADGSHCKET